MGNNDGLVSESLSAQTASIKTPKNKYNSKDFFKFTIKATEEQNESSACDLDELETRSLTSLANVNQDFELLRLQQGSLPRASTINDEKNTGKSKSALFERRKRSLSHSDVLSRRLGMLQEQEDPYSDRPDRSRRKPVRITRLSASDLSELVKELSVSKQASTLPFSSANTHNSATQTLISSGSPQSKSHPSLIHSVPLSLSQVTQNKKPLSSQRHQRAVSTSRLNQGNLDSWFVPPSKDTRSEVSSETSNSKKEWYKNMFKTMNPGIQKGEEQLDWADSILDTFSKPHPINLKTDDRFYNYAPQQHNTLPKSLTRRPKERPEPVESDLMFEEETTSRTVETKHWLHSTTNPNVAAQYNWDTNVQQPAQLMPNQDERDSYSVASLKKTADVSSPVSSSAGRFRRDRPRRIDEFREIRNYFDSLSHENSANHRRTQSLDRAKTSNKSRFVGEARSKIESIPDAGAQQLSGGLVRNNSRGSKWQTSKMDENFLARQQYRYTVREPRNAKPPRPELPASNAIDTEFINRNSRYRHNNGFQNELLDKNKSISSSSLKFDNTFKAIFDPGPNASFSKSNDNLTNGQGTKQVSTYSLSLKTGDENGRDHKRPGSGQKSRANRFIDSDSDDSMSLHSQVETYHRKRPPPQPGTANHLFNNADVRANLEETIQKCNGKINGNHKGLFGSTGSLTGPGTILQKRDQNLIDFDAKEDTRSTQLHYKPQHAKDSKPLLVKSGIDLWETRIEHVEIEKEVREREEITLKSKQVLSPMEESKKLVGQGRSQLEHVVSPTGNKAFVENAMETPTGSNKSSLKESEADMNEYNFSMSSKFAAVNSIPQPYSRQKMGGVPFEPSAKFKNRSSNDLMWKPVAFENKASDELKRKVDDQDPNQSSQNHPVKIYDDFEEDHVSTVENDSTDKYIYFPTSKKLVKVGSQDETESFLKQVNLTHDSGFFITVKKQVREDRLTKIEAIGDRREERAKIRDDVREVAMKLHEREKQADSSGSDHLEAGKIVRMPSERTAKMKNAWNSASVEKLDTLSSDNRENVAYEHFSSKLRTHIVDNKKSGTSQPKETEIGRDLIMSPTGESVAIQSQFGQNNPRGLQNDFASNNVNRRFKKNDNSTHRNVGLVQPMPGNRALSVDALNFGGLKRESSNEFMSSGLNEPNARVPLSQGNMQDGRNRYSLMSHMSEFDSQLGSRFQSSSPVVDETTSGKPSETVHNYPLRNTYGKEMSKTDARPGFGVPIKGSNEFNAREADSGVELDYNSPNSEEMKGYHVKSSPPPGPDRISGDVEAMTNRGPRDERVAGFKASSPQLFQKQSAPESPSKDYGNGGKPIKKVFSHVDGPVEPHPCCGAQKIFKKRSKSRDDNSPATGRKHDPDIYSADNASMNANSYPKAPPVENMPVEKPKPVMSPTPTYATVLYKFEPQSEIELAVKKNQVVMVRKDVDDSWVEAEVDGRVGIVPRSYLKLMEGTANRSGVSNGPASRLATENNRPATMHTSANPDSLKNSFKPVKSAEVNERSRRDVYERSAGAGVQNGEQLSTNQFKVKEQEKMQPLSVEIAHSAGPQKKEALSSKSQQQSAFAEGDRVVAKYTFRAENASELDLRKNEVVIVTKRIDENWLEGTAGKRTGIFPLTYVEKVPEANNPHDHVYSTPKSQVPFEVSAPKSHSKSISSQNISSTSVGNTTTADLFPTVGGTNKSLQKGQPNNSAPANYQHSPASFVSSDWQSNNNNTAPLNSTLNSSSNAVSEEHPYRVKFRYEPENADELRLEEGDIVYVTEICDDGWYIGRSQHSDVHGAFPGNYVVKL